MKRLKLLSIPVLIFSLISCVTTNTPAGNAVTRVSSERTSGSRFKDSIHQLALAIQPSVSSSSMKKTIAILAFQPSDLSPSFAQQVQDHLLEEYFNLGRFKIIERESLDRILKEQNLQLSGIVNETEAKRVGRIIGVDFISFGTIAKFNNVIRISGRTTSVETGEIVAISSVEIPIDDDLSSMLGVTKSTDVVEKPKSSISLKSPWTVTKKLNDFDGVYVYTLKTPGTTTGVITIGYVKNKDPLRSYVRIGITNWEYSSAFVDVALFEIKDAQGTVHQMRLEKSYWSGLKGITKPGDHEYYLYTSKPRNRDFFNLLLDNEVLIVRYVKDSNIQRFNTSMLRETIIAQGLTPSEISKAIGNEEF